MTEFQTWPKAELHVHLDGSLRPETVWELARSSRIRLPFDSLAELTRHLRVPRRCTLPQYLQAFQHTVAVMQEREHLQRVAHEFLEDVAQDGVRYVEVRFAPSLHGRGGLTMEQITEAVLAGLQEGQRSRLPASTRALVRAPHRGHATLRHPSSARKPRAVGAVGAGASR